MGEVVHLDEGFNRNYAEYAAKISRRNRRTAMAKFGIGGALLAGGALLVAETVAFPPGIVPTLAVLLKLMLGTGAAVGGIGLIESGNRNRIRAGFHDPDTGRPSRVN